MPPCSSPRYAWWRGTCARSTVTPRAPRSRGSRRGFRSSKPSESNLGGFRSADVVPAHAGTHIPEAVGIGPRLFGGGSIRGGLGASAVRSHPHHQPVPHLLL